MKSKILFMLFILMIISLFAFTQSITAKGYEIENTSRAISSTEQVVDSDIQSIVDTSNRLTDTWLNSLEKGNWLYVSTVYETNQDLGYDPETKLKIPQKSLWESWFVLDEDGHQNIVLTKRTDLENTDNVVYVGWKDSLMLRLPSQTYIDTSQQGGAWENFRPLIDHDCNSRLQNLLVDIKEDGVVKEVSEEWKTSTSGFDQWIIKINTSYPPVSDVSGFSETFVGHEFVCYRDGDVGSIESTEEYLITDQNEHILIGHNFDYKVMWIDSLPDEMNEVLIKLNEKLP